MASLLTKMDRKCFAKFRRRPVLFVLVIFTLVLTYKTFSKLRTPPKLYKDAAETIKKNRLAAQNKAEKSKCSSRMRSINSYIVHLRDVTINTHKHTIENGKLFLWRGFFKVHCTGQSSMTVSHSRFSHFPRWSSIIDLVEDDNADETGVSEGATLLVRRSSDLDAYARINDAYNAFLTVTMMGVNPKDTGVMFIDAVHIDASAALWEIIFSEYSHIGDINGKYQIETCFWSIPGDLGPMAASDLPIPYLEEFRYHVISNAEAFTTDEINCKYIRLTLLTSEENMDKRKYLSHALTNTDEILQALEKAFPEFDIASLQPDVMNTREQIQTYAKTDILIGVNGNELANAVFLHRGAGLIELFSSRGVLQSDMRFQQMAAWRKVYYANWYRSWFVDVELMKVPPDVIISLVKAMKERICAK